MQQHHHHYFRHLLSTLIYRKTNENFGKLIFSAAVGTSNDPETI
jgi:hypothetical protein